MNFVKANLLSCLALLAMTGMSIYLYQDLPDLIPSDFDIHGNARGTQPKLFFAFLMPAIYLGLIVIVNLLISYSPQKFSMPNSKRAMQLILFGVGALFLFVHTSLLLADGDFNFFTKYFSIGMALFLVISGNVFGKSERNFFLGIRTPWTIASHANWSVTHRLAGRLMVITGLILLLSSAFYSSMVITTVLSVATVLIPTFYSFIYFLRNERNEEPN
jgi:uncharacterized membrane protein